jgi:hypothetical protein
MLIMDHLVKYMWYVYCDMFFVPNVTMLKYVLMYFSCYIYLFTSNKNVFLCIEF